MRSGQNVHLTYLSEKYSGNDTARGFFFKEFYQHHLKGLPTDAAYFFLLQHFLNPLQYGSHSPHLTQIALLRSARFSMIPNAVDALQALAFQRQQHETYSLFFRSFSFSSAGFPPTSLAGCVRSIRPHNAGIP